MAMVSRRLLIALGLVAVLAVVLYFGVRRALGASTASTTLSSTLPGTISNNARVVLTPTMFAFQLAPYGGGDYAILVNNGVPSTIPDPVTPMPGVDYSNITGRAIIGNYIVFGGGENSSQPWSPCAAPCAPYQGFFNMSTGKLVISKLQGGSCDNMNMSGAVPGNNGDIIIFGGSSQGSTTGSTGYAIYNSSLQPYLFGMLSPNDNEGNPLDLYRKPSTLAGSTVYFVAKNLNNSHAIVESVTLSQLYSNGTSVINVLCGTSNTITPTYVADIASSWVSGGVQALYYNNGTLYFLFQGGDGIVKIASLNLTNGAINTVNLIQSSSIGPFLEIVNGTAYVGMQNGNTFTVNKYTLSGSLIQTISFPGQGFVDPQGYVVVFSNGLNAGSTISITKV